MIMMISMKKYSKRDDLVAKTMFGNWVGALCGATTGAKLPILLP